MADLNKGLKRKFLKIQGLGNKNIVGGIKPTWINIYSIIEDKLTIKFENNDSSEKLPLLKIVYSTTRI